MTFFMFRDFSRKDIYIYGSHQDAKKACFKAKTNEDFNNSSPSRTIIVNRLSQNSTIDVQSNQNSPYLSPIRRLTVGWKAKE